MIELFDWLMMANEASLSLGMYEMNEACSFKYAAEAPGFGDLATICCESSPGAVC